MKEPPDRAELGKLAGLGKTNIAGLVNLRSTAFRKMKVDLNSLHEDAIADMITANPRIMIRPLLTDGAGLVAGFKKDEMALLIGK